MERYKLSNFNLYRNPYSGDLRLFVSGTKQYKDILSRALTSLYFSQIFEDRDGEYDWGVYIKGADAQDVELIVDFCQLLQHVVFINDDLDENFALAFHTRKDSATGRPERTLMGQLVRDAKP